jgi:hypothetical protein
MKTIAVTFTVYVVSLANRFPCRLNSTSIPDNLVGNYFGRLQKHVGNIESNSEWKIDFVRAVRALNVMIDGAVRVDAKLLPTVGGTECTKIHQRINST